ncbi:MAG: hypothetical protein Q9162_003489 [Coniocarpon cinnabarinum]
MSPVIPEHETPVVSKGLRRIRQQSPTLERSETFPRSASMTFTIPSTPSSPALSRVTTDDPMWATAAPTAGEDLTRFVAESLHSFSFANQADEDYHQRQKALKRSIDFVRDMPGWTEGNLAMANAGAKASGDTEMQKMLEMISRMKASGQEKQAGQDDEVPAPLMTGPAQMQDNPFEKSFTAHQTESPTDIQPSNPEETITDEDAVSTPTQETVGVRVHPPPDRAATFTPFSNTGKTIPRHRRASLKRTFTDTQGLSLQNKLSEAITQPFKAIERRHLAPIQTQAKVDADLPVTSGSSHQMARTPPNTQAIFTTAPSEPWTITAANDLGCLIFGLSKQEFRKMSILDLFREEKRQWLELRLQQRSEAVTPSPTRSRPPLRKTPSPRMSNIGSGITARLLSKPPSRETSRTNRPTHTDEPAAVENKPPNLPAIETKISSDTAKFSSQLPSSRGVLVCGEVLPVTKRDGSASSASLWVQEKRNNLIWVLEEVAEDVAFVDVDAIGCVTKASGACEAVWGMERVRRGMDITRLLPGIPRLKGTNTGALDFDAISILRRFTARTANDISTPVTVDRVNSEQNLADATTTFRVSSFPHIAGMMVLNSRTLHINSCNTVVADTLFGKVPNGLPMNDVVPDFDQMLEHLVEDEKIPLIEGMVIPEQSFRRARAMLALREGKRDAAAVFLRPGGLPALHRDGAEIMIDVQMRVVKSESLGYDLPNRTMEDGLPASPLSTPSSEVVYALWVTYSRVLHAVNHGVGPISPLVSRPGTPPHQPSPVDAPMSRSSSSSGSSVNEDSDTPPTTPHLSPRPTKSTRHAPPPAPTPPPPTVSKPLPHPASAATTSQDVRARRLISDYSILEDMGAGAYGQVKLARHKSSGNKVVIKYVTKARILVDTWTRDRRLGTVPLEIHVLDYLARTYSGSDGNRMYHPNIVQMSAFFEDDTNYYIEMVPHGLPGLDLFDYIELRTDLTEESARNIFRQVAEAVRFLHIEAGVVHRDIKDENVILDREERIRLVDFGSSSYVRNGPFDVFVGTIDYAAPEVLSGSSYSGLEQDVWAMGILLYTILYKENPFYSIDEIMDRDLRVPVVPAVSEGALTLVKGMLERDVPKRMGVEEVCGDEWLQGDD